MRLNRLAVLALLLGLVGCGVKGDPEPPDTPPQLGHGQPSYQKAIQELAFPDLPPVHPKEDDEDKDE